MRKRELAIGLGGVFLGAWLAGRSSPPDSEAPVAALPPPRTPVIRAQKSAPPPPPVAAAPAPTPEDPAPKSEFAHRAAPSFVVPRSEYVGLRLNEELVDELESLPASALAAAGEVLRTEEGWRFRQLDPRSPWIRAGMREDDVLPYGILRQQGAIPERARLAGRLAAVLDRVAR